MLNGLRHVQAKLIKPTQGRSETDPICTLIPIILQIIKNFQRKVKGYEPYQSIFLSLFCYFLNEESKKKSTHKTKHNS